MIKNLRHILTCPSKIFLIVLCASVLALTGAYIAEYFFGLKPCILCLYQRVPFYIAIGLCVLGLVFCKTIDIRIAFLCALTVNLSANTVLAFYHSGVERHWWPSIFEACSAKELSGLRGQDLAQAILAAPAVRCDVMPWADPLLGLSMANYNVLYCLGLAGLCAITLWNFKQSRKD